MKSATRTAATETVSCIVLLQLDHEANQLQVHCFGDDVEGAKGSAQRGQEDGDGTFGYQVKRVNGPRAATILALSAELRACKDDARSEQLDAAITAAYLAR